MRIWLIKLLVSVALSLAMAVFVRSDLFNDVVVEPLMGAAAAQRDPLRDLPAALAQAQPVEVAEAEGADTSVAGAAPVVAPRVVQVRGSGAPISDSKASVRVNRAGAGGDIHRVIRVGE